ncbi:unnamed protein product [Merluccius merluccius]
MAMTSNTANDNLWQVDSIADTQPSQLQPDQCEDASLDDNTATAVHRSSRLASKNPYAPSLGDWPVSKILETLFKHHIQPPIGASHKDLLALCDSLDFPPASASTPSIRKKVHSETQTL